ncbi:MAG: hypothetical protein ABI353_22730, partial [Isosphaeraceae bacterium]
MASHHFDPAKDKARIFFRYGGRQFNKTVRVDSDRAAFRLCALIEETIQDLERGKLTMPVEADPVAFLMSGGKVTSIATKQVAAPKAVTLSDLFDLYRTDPPPHLETSTRKMQEIHFRRLLEVLPRADIQTFDKSSAQFYISRRSKQAYRGRPIQRETIQKELKTLRQAWMWVAGNRAREGFPAPTWAMRELSFPKAREPLPFMSWGQIEKEIGRGNLNKSENDDLWDCLWLDKGQVRELLEFVSQASAPAFLHPMIAFAAYTGARRSELCRSRLADWRFDV